MDVVYCPVDNCAKRCIRVSTIRAKLFAPLGEFFHIRGGDIFSPCKYKDQEYLLNV